jgi:hypothetical protein
MATTTQRRHRFKPEPKDIRASNSPATLAVLETLQAYRYLPVDHIVPLSGFSYDWLKKRIIPTLFNEGYVFVPEEAKQSYLARNRPRVLAISDKGETHLKDYARWRPTIKKKVAFRHTFNGELTRASFEIATKEIPHLHLVKGAEILAGKRCPQSTRDDENPFIIPVNNHTIRPDDDLMGYRYSPPHIRDCGLREAAQALSDHFMDSVPARDRTPPQSRERRSQPPPTFDAQKYFDELNPHAPELEPMGLDFNLVAELGGLASKGVLRDHLALALRKRDGETVCYVGVPEDGLSLEEAERLHKALGLVINAVISLDPVASIVRE